MSQVKVLLADDHDLFREGLCRMLEAEERIEIVGEAKDGHEVLKKTQEVLPDVVLMDINMPKLDGIKATYQIKRICPSVEVIVLSMYEDDEHVFRAIKAGAKGYLMKDSSVDEVVGVIKAASQGESLLNPALARKVLNEFAATESADKSKKGFYNNLTARELEILQSLASAKSNRETAKSLFISEKTVKNHVSNIYRKLQVNTRTEAVLKAIKLNLVDLVE